MSKKKPAKLLPKSKPAKATKAKPPLKPKVKVSSAKKKSTEPNYAEILPEMLGRIAKPKVKELHGIVQGYCEIQIANVCIAPKETTKPLKNEPLKTFEFVVQQRRMQVCMPCARYQEKTGAWDLEPVKGKRI